jgi:hypothetical protein
MRKEGQGDSDQEHLELLASAKTKKICCYSHLTTFRLAFQFTHTTHTHMHTYTHVGAHHTYVYMCTLHMIDIYI